VPGISIHVIDVSRGVVAAGMKVELHGPQGGIVAAGVTNAKGLLENQASMPAGFYEARFHVAAWYREQGVSAAAGPFPRRGAFPLRHLRPAPALPPAVQMYALGYSCFRGGA